MKTPLQIIERMVNDYPNDMELGSRVRYYIRWLKEPKNKNKEEEEAIKKPKASEESTDQEETEDQPEATAEVFEKVESSEATLIESQEVDPVESTRASVADWLSKNVLSK